MFPLGVQLVLGRVRRRCSTSAVPSVSWGEGKQVNHRCMTSLYRTEAWGRARRAALRPDGWLCTCCEAANSPLEVHHLRPVRAGGAGFAPSNLKSVCCGCHGAVYHEMDHLSADEQQSQRACEAAFRRVRRAQRAQWRARQLRLPFPLVSARSGDWPTVGGTCRRPIIAEPPSLSSIGRTSKPTAAIVCSR